MAEPICFTTNTEVAIEFDGNTFTLKKGNNVIFLSRTKMQELGCLAEEAGVCRECEGSGTSPYEDDMDWDDHKGCPCRADCGNCGGSGIVSDQKVVDKIIGRLEGKVRT